MPYQTALTAIAGLIAGGNLPELSANDISDEGNYDLLNGSHKYVVILDYAGMRGERAELGPSWYHWWDVEVTLAVAYRTPTQVHEDLRDLRQEVIDEIGDTPDLDISSNLYEATVAEGRPLPTTLSVGGIKWQAEILTIRVRELREY